MGKIKVATIGDPEAEARQKEEMRVKREEKIKREKAKGQEEKRVNELTGSSVSSTAGSPSGRNEVENETEEKKEDKKGKKETKSKDKKIKGKGQTVKGKKYSMASKKVDQKKLYDLESSVKLLKSVKFADFDETVEIHLNLKESNVKGEVSLPHGTGKSVKVVIADEAVLAEIEKGVINFDILLSTPAFMPKLVKFARVLGPKGLMPNPKNGTVSPKPEEAMKKFSGGTIRFKSESKFPLLHQAVGKSSFEEKQLTENLTSFINAVGKRNILEAFVSTTMSPSVKLDLEKI